MKLPLHLLGRRRRALLVLIISASSALGVGCSEPAQPELVDMGLPAMPAGPVPAAPGTVFGAPGDGISVSTPIENDGPGATETNFLTPPCGGDGSRLIPDAGTPRDGALSDAGAPQNPADAGVLQTVRTPASPLTSTAAARGCPARSNPEAAGASVGLEARSRVRPRWHRCVMGSGLPERADARPPDDSRNFCA
jgi:hypothetical protein